MGILDAIKGQFIEVIEWTNTDNNLMVYRFPVRNAEIKMGAQLTVRESQAAIFVNEGQLADCFLPGRYELKTENMPILSKLKAWKYGFNSPFKAEVYFINTNQFLEQKFGTQNPIPMRDAEFGMIRLRLFGIYSFRVADPVLFLREVFGTQERFTTDGVTGQIKRSIITSLTDALGEAKIPALDLPSQYEELSDLTKDRLEPQLNAIGLTMPTLRIENISMPEAVEKAIDQRSSMGALGDMGRYTQYQAAEAMRDAAQNPSGGAGMGVGMGAGLGMGQAMAQAITQGVAQGAASPQQPAAAAQPCPHCGKAVTGGKFCPHCGQPLGTVCPACKQALSGSPKFCPHCGVSLGAAKCAKCGAELGSSKFCPECGTQRG